MKKTLLLMLFFLASCASVSNYPLNLSYHPLKQYEKTGGRTIAIAMLYDKRSVADKRVLGARDNDAQFIALIDTPSAAFKKAFKENLENRGFVVNRLNEVWDGTQQALKPEWGGMVLGGYIEDFSINAKGGLFKPEYVCSIKLYLVFADAKVKQIRHQERFEVSSSYIGVSFSRDKAEELINSAMSEAVERALNDINRYFPGQ